MQQERKRVVNLTQIANTIGDCFAKALPAIHAFSGCDSTSAFVGKGKRSVYSMAKNDTKLTAVFQSLGASFEIDDVPPEIEWFVCKLYGSSKQSVEDARYELFCMKTNGERSIPPTKDALLQHVKRANYQTAVWRRSHQSNICAPSPSGHGWITEDGQLVVKWMSQPIAPAAVLQTVACKCSVSKCSGRCSCRSAGLPCTELCSCKECDNSLDKDIPYREEDEADEGI